MHEKKFDLVVIGSGPGGYVAALHGAHRGLKVGCIEKSEKLGGTCLNVGCIPSKTLLQVTEMFSWLQNSSKEQGIECVKGVLNFSQMMHQKRQVVAGLTDSISSLFKKQQIDEIHGTARLLSSNTIEVVNKEASQIIEAEYIILAPGSKPVELPFLPFDEKQILSSTGALGLKEAPKSLVVIGGGVIGVELASVYSRLGCEVTVVEILDRICPELDIAIAKTFLQILKKQKIKFHLKHNVESMTRSAKEVTLQIKNREDNSTFSLVSEAVLVAVGRRPFSDGLSLEKVGVEVSPKGFIVVDGAFRTNLANVFAIGDVIEGPMLAHRATSEAIACVEYFLGKSQRLNYYAIPNVIYTHPEVAVVGVTEEEAGQAGFETMIGTASFRGNARARCMGEVEGVVKIVADKSTEALLGLHILGPHASEMIGIGVMAIESNMSVRQLAFAPFAHPTLSEAIKEAAMAALGLALHA